MKLTTVDPFSATPAPADPAALRVASPEISDPVEFAAKLKIERQRLVEDAEALQLREANLRDYEARLRALQSEIDNTRGGAPRSSTPFQSRSSTPFPSDAGLDAAWQKLHRARELCEAEQAHLRDDRIAMRAFELELKQREALVTAREILVTEQEAIIAAGARPAKAQPVPEAEQPSAFKRFTRVPFLVAETLRGKNDKKSGPAAE